MTRLRSLAAGLAAIAGVLIAGRAGAGGLNCDWTGAANTAWDNPANWSNCGGGIPAATDTAAITNVANQPVVSTATPVGGLSLGTGTTLTIASPGGNLTLVGPVFGAGNIVVDGTLTWIAGGMGGTGVTTIQPGGVLSLLNMASKVLDRNIGVMPGGVTTMTGGDSSLIITDTHVFANSGLFHIQNGSNITGAGRFENLPNGIFRTSISPGLVNITVEEWINTGLVEVLSGTLSFAAGIFVHGGTYLFDTTRLYFPTGTHTVIGTFDGGTLEMNASVNFLAEATLTNMVPSVEIRGATTLNTGEPLVFASLLLDGGTIIGSDNITATLWTWPSGTIAGPGTMEIVPGGVMNLDGPGLRTLDRNTLNGGQAVMGGTPGSLVIPPNRTFTNVFIGSFTIGNDSVISGEATFENHGIFRRVSSPGSAIVDLDFHNQGTFRLETGTTTVHEYHQSAGATQLAGGDLIVVHETVHLEGGTIEGVGDIFASFEASGSGAVVPGSSEGTITIHGDYRQSHPAAYQAELGSPASDLIAASGQARLGGILNATVTGAPIPNTDYVLLSYASRVGRFGFASVSAPPPAGFSWSNRYGATGYSLRLQALLPNDPLSVDVRTIPGGFGNQNGVFEPGEIVPVDPTWLRFVPGSIPNVTGTASNFVGPMGGTYGIVDAAADYGTIDPGGSPGVNCADVGAGNCYTLSVNDPPSRPALHWDTTFDETLNNSDPATYTLHIGRSFLDVPPADGFYRFIETLLHHQVTSGCGGDSYCPASSVTRAQMAVFLMVSKFGPSYLPPAATGTVFTDVPLGSFAAAFIEDIAARQVTAGCGGGNYCPGDSVTREQMAVFLLRTLEGPVYVPPDCTTPTFTDVPCSSGFAKWVNEIALRGITAGCGGGNYCPAQPVTRGQMAVFLTATFSLALNGP